MQYLTQKKGQLGLLDATAQDALVLNFSRERQEFTGKMTVGMRRLAAQRFN